MIFPLRQQKHTKCRYGRRLGCTPRQRFTGCHQSTSCCMLHIYFTKYKAVVCALVSCRTGNLSIIRDQQKISKSNNLKK